MKSSWRYGFAVAAVALLCLPAVAQQATQEAPDRNGVQVEVRRGTVNLEHSAVKRDKSDLPVRASQVIGMAVKNHEDEDLGNIKDLVIDPKSGKVRYAAVSMGGFLGLGDELFAVPWGAITCQKDEDGNYVALLNVDKARMENAKGFDQDNWPDFGDERWQRENDARYDVDINVKDKVRVETNSNNGNSRVPDIEIERDR
jgi:sporulation protein YlmC with PRC-barrel domain